MIELLQVKVLSNETKHNKRDRFGSDPCDPTEHEEDNAINEVEY